MTDRPALAPTPTVPGLHAVTGASGFIGRHLVTALLDGGVPVRAVVRRAPDTPSRAGLEIAVAPLDDRAALRRALSGATTLVHLAGRAHQMHEPDGDPAAAFRMVNVEGLRTVLEEARIAGVSRVLFLSSIGAIASTSAVPVSDDTLPSPQSAYGWSKLAAEGVVRDLCSAAGMDHLILRPPMVIGPGMKGNPLRLFQAVMRGVPLPLGSVRNRRSLIYVGNLIQAIQCALALPRGTNDTFVVGDGPPLSSAELVRAVADALGRPARLVPVPELALDVAGRLGDAIDRVVRFPVTTDTVQRLTGSLAVDDARFRRVTGYQPTHTFADAMRTTARWFLDAESC